MISVKKLRRLLAYLNIGYCTLNQRIIATKKGHKISIKNPKFPINLATPEGACLLGMVVSDGCIYVDKKARNKLRTKYSSGEKPLVDKFINFINQVYGQTHIQKENIRHCDILKVGSSIIGETLLKVGAIVGQKAAVNGRVPWLVRFGSLDLKKSYLGAIFDDESSIFNGDKKYRSYIILTRYSHVKNLTEQQQSQLNQLDNHMSERSFPTGHINKTITLKKALALLADDDLSQLLNVPSRLLIDEAQLLRELGIENRFFGRSLNKTHLGRYSIAFDLFINKKESLLKFYKHISFSLENKQKKLKSIVGGQCAESLQHHN